MRILLISHGAGPYGAERVLLSLSEGLAGRGHDVVLGFPHDGPAAEAAARIPGIRCLVDRRRRLPRDMAEGAAYLARAAPDIMAARRLIRKIDPDLVWVNSLYNPWAGLAARLERRVVVWHVHEYRPREPLGLTTGVLLGVVATRVVVVSGFLAGGWGRYSWLRRRLVSLPNPLLDDLRPGPEPPAPFTVGYVGQLEPRKRVPDLVRAVALVPDTRCVLVGDGKARRTVEEAIVRAGVADRVELRGFRADVAEQLARFHCLAIPSVREPFGLVALEAMAAGVPVVAARSGALPEVLGDAAVYHAPGDVRDLAQRIRSLREERARRVDLRENGLQRVRRYRRDAWLERADAIARDAASGRGGP